MRQRILKSFIAAVMIQIMHGAFCEAEDVKHARKDSGVECGELYGTNPDSCGTNCGIKKWTDDKENPRPCDLETNRNYGCHDKDCWRSDVNEPGKWCYTRKYCGDNHTLCKDQVLSSCRKKYNWCSKIKDYPCECGELYGTNPDSCGTNCGLEKWTVRKRHLCDLETNRNYGCHDKECWRSDVNAPGQWCYTGKYCDDNHTLCKDRVLSSCRKKYNWCSQTFKDYPCDLKTERNYGCSEKNCWRNKFHTTHILSFPQDSCYTGKWCGDGKNDDNHTLCKDQVSSRCRTKTSCGLERWTVGESYPCDRETNRNYGCYYKRCWRSDANANEPEKWCYTGKWCWDGKNVNNHKLCQDQFLAPCGDKPQEVRCGELNMQNPASCNTSCGIKELTDDISNPRPCNSTTNRNYGCYINDCWRSDADQPNKWCYTGKWCGDGKNTMDNHELCMDQTLSPCGKKCTPEEVRCGELNLKNPACCGTSCGIKKWTDAKTNPRPCNSTTNRNYGCDNNHCWRSDMEMNKPEKWCYTGKWCWDGKNVNNHELCKDQTLALCSKKRELPEGVRCGELYLKNPANCSTSCGIKKWTWKDGKMPRDDIRNPIPCDPTTNRNYGCWKDAER